MFVCTFDVNANDSLSTCENAAMRKKLSHKVYLLAGAIAIATAVLFAPVFASGNSTSLAKNASELAQNTTESVAYENVPTNDEQAGSPSSQNASSYAESETANPSTPSSGQSATEASPSETPKNRPLTEGVDCKPGSLLINFAEGFNPQEALEKLVSDTGLEGLRIAKIRSRYVELALPQGIGVAQARDAIAQSSVIDAVQPNFRYYLMDDTRANPQGLTAGQLASSDDNGNSDGDGEGSTSDPDDAGENNAQPSDPLVPWSLNDPFASNLWGLSSVHALEAWTITRTQGSVGVAIIDNVFNVEHEDLKDNIAVSFNAATDDADDMAGKNYNFSDKNHGTHVAGIIAAEADNSIGVAGVSYNAKLIPIRTASDDGSFYEDAILDAYDFVFNHQNEYNIRVVNMSLGAYQDTDEWETQDDAILQAIDEAWNKGIITVTSAGNAGTYDKVYRSAPFSCYPGDYDTCVNVINLQQSTSNGVTTLIRSTTSNYNLGARKNKDIAAPGSNIYSTMRESEQYGSLSGTSMAAPCVAGILALEFAANPQLSAQEAVNLLYSTAIDLGNAGFDAVFGYGEANALEAVIAAKATSNQGGGSAGDGGEGDDPHPGSQSGEGGNPSGGNQSGEGNESGGDDPAGDGTDDNGQSGNSGDGDENDSPSTSQPINLGGATITLSAYSYTYSGAPNRPTPTVSIAGKTLQPGTDYTVSYANNVKAGKATVSIEAKSPEYTGHASAAFTIKKARISGAQLAQTLFTYNGKARTPKPIVASGTAQLKKKRDYTVSYSNNVKAGRATVTVQGTGNYTGKKTIKFRIRKADNTIAVRGKSAVVTLGASSNRKLTISRDDVLSLKKARGKTTFALVDRPGFISIAKRTGTIALASTAPQGTYRVKIRVKAAGTKNYKPATRYATATIRVA